MSASLVCPWPCGCIYGLLFLASLSHLSAGRLGSCSHPLVPEHGGFGCDPSPCRGFPQKSYIYFFCEPGYHISSKVRSSKCHQGKWLPPIPTCTPLKESPNESSEDKAAQSLPSVATTAVAVAIFLLTTTVCLILKSRLCPCHSHSTCQSLDQLDLMAEGPTVPLPSYEEAVYGSWGQRLPTCLAPGPTQLLMNQDTPECHHSPLNGQSDTSHGPLLSEHTSGSPPPPYKEVQSHPRDRLSDGDTYHLQLALSDDKDI
ncbi:sushi domain-containing protein 6 [Thalassophryne amazonica]|uniref:sushi domain-containing protein 6 n=1 Tax=Thalassophryne amazonica TaxID=390379 RepID=UPI0014713F6D|nr:sushi domain-containing protein 6 [Thalassophryne amazonica]